MKQKINVLFISYDGMTDALGQSQILPYLTGLSERGYVITILSCEKKERFRMMKKDIVDLIGLYGIQWHHVFFSSKPPVLSKYYDLVRLKNKAVALYKAKGFDLVHCRSYVSADIGLYLKKRFGIKLLFDMRGFWVDERVDGGAWNLKHAFFRLAYKKYKKKESAYIKNADAIISLTEAGKKEMETWPAYTGTSITVIPCSTDFSLFTIVDTATRAASREKLSISKDALVISYLGSIGAWYLLDDMLAFFAQAKKTYTDAIFLFISNEDPKIIFSASRKHGVNKADLRIVSATRNEVPLYVAASDLNVFFIKQSYSKIASSPTKLGEILAMGIPVICNSKIGDVEDIVSSADAGVVIKNFSSEEYERAIGAIPLLLQKEASEIRGRALGYYRLEDAVNRYASVYYDLLSV